MLLFLTLSVCELEGQPHQRPLKHSKVRCGEQRLRQQDCCPVDAIVAVLCPTYMLLFCILQNAQEPRAQRQK